MKIATLADVRDLGLLLKEHGATRIRVSVDGVAVDFDHPPHVRTAGHFSPAGAAELPTLEPLESDEERQKRFEAELMYSAGGE